MSMIDFGDGAEEALVTVASHIPFGCNVALLNEGQQLPEGSTIVPDIDVRFIACDEDGVIFGGLDAKGDLDGTTGFRPWTDIDRIHVY